MYSLIVRSSGMLLGAPCATALLLGEHNDTHVGFQCLWVAQLRGWRSLCGCPRRFQWHSPHFGGKKNQPNNKTMHAFRSTEPQSIPSWMGSIRIESNSSPAKRLKHKLKVSPSLSVPPEQPLGGVCRLLLKRKISWHLWIFATLRF